MSEETKYQVVVSSMARSMLIEHARFLAQVSMNAAEELLDRFEEKVVALEELPERCPYYENPYVKPGKYRKLALGKHLLILFQIVAREVFIELIIDARAENMHLY